jgi:WD40 repeat protein
MLSFDSEDQPDETLSWIKFESIPSAATAAVATFAPHKFMDLTTIDHSLGHSRGFKMMSIFTTPRTSALPGSAVLNSETYESVRFSLMATCHAAFSPDGSLFVSQYRDGVFSTAVMSENMDNPVYTGIDSKDEERSFFSKRPSNWRYTFSENNQWLASQKEEGAVVLWHLNQPEPQQTSVRHADAAIEAVCFSADSTTLMCIVGDRLVAYSLATGAWLPLNVPLSSGPVQSHSSDGGAESPLFQCALIASPLGHQVVACSPGTVQLIDLALGTVIAHHDCTVAGLEYSPDGRVLLAGTALLDAHTLAPLGAFALDGHRLWDAGFLSDGRLMILAHRQEDGARRRRSYFGVPVMAVAATLSVRPPPAMRAFYAWVLCKQGVPSSEGRVTLPADVAPLIVQHLVIQVGGAR